MALSRDVVIRLLGDASSAEKAIKAAADAAEVSVSAYRKAERAFDQQQKSVAIAAAKQRDSMASIGRAATIMGAVVAAGLALSAKAAIDWETAWAGVSKTVSGTPQQMDELEASLRNLATTLPATHEEIAGVAEAAGQLGIAREDIAQFTEVAIAMGVSTNLSAEEAATGLARLSNIMGTASSDVDRLGSTLVALGNAGASTEGEILNMGIRIAAAGRQAGLSEGEVLGLANAMSSLGIEAEAGGTAISTVIKDINSAVLDGGDQLERYAEVAGTSASEFATAWREDAASALVLVVQGLGRMQEQGENVNTTIEDLGLSGIRTSDTLLRLAGDADGLAESLATGNEAWVENDALMNEANKRYETAASQIAIARNEIADAAIDIGGLLLPALSSVVEVVADFARGFANLPGPLQAVVTVIGTAAASVALLGGVALTAVPKVLAFRTAMQTLTSSGGGAQTALGKFGLFMTGPWGAAIGIATIALGGLVAWLGSSSRASESAASYQRDLADALRESGGAIDDNVRAIAAHRAADEEVGDSNLLAIAQQLGFDLPTVTDALLGQRDAYDQLAAAANAYIDEALTAEHAGDPEWTQNAEDARLFLAALDDVSGSMGGAVADNERLAAALEDSGDAASNTTSTMDPLVGVTDDLAGSAGDAASAAQDLADALDELNGPTLDLREATRGYQEQLDAITEAMKADEWVQSLDETTEAGRANAQMLDDLAQKAMEQANAIVASGGSYDAFRNSLESARGQLVDAAKAMGATQAQAEALADQILQIPDEASIDVAVPTYQQVTDQLVDVYNKVKGLPPQTWMNVGVLSQQAIDALEDVGFRVRTLPDGTVEVYAETAAAEAALNNTARDRSSTIYQYVETVGHVGGRASGGPVWPGTFLVGEEGPELVTMGGYGYVTPAPATAQILGTLAGGALPGFAAGGFVNNGVRVGSAVGSTVVKVAAPDLRGLVIRGHVTFDANGVATIAGRVVDQALGEIHDQIEYS